MQYMGDGTPKLRYKCRMIVKNLETNIVQFRAEEQYLPHMFQVSNDLGRVENCPNRDKEMKTFRAIEIWSVWKKSRNAENTNAVPQDYFDEN